MLFGVEGDSEIRVSKLLDCVCRNSFDRDRSIFSIVKFVQSMVSEECWRKL